MSAEDREGPEGVVSLLAGIGIGLLVGAAVALLLAPQPGEQTRRRLRESADEALGRLKESMDELRAKVEEIASRRAGAGAGAPPEGAPPAAEGASPSS